MIVGIIFSIVLIIVVILYQKKETTQQKKPDNKLNIKKKNNSALKTISNNENSKFLNKEFLDIYNELEQEFHEGANFYEFHSCPNCGVVYEKKITTSITCKYCNKKIIKRRNYLTKQNYLLTESSFKIFEKYQNQINELKFYEQQFKKLSNIESEIKYYIEKNSHKTGIASTRDLFWSICIELSTNYVNCGYTILKKAEKSNKDNFEAFENARHLFNKDLLVQSAMINVAEYNKKYNVVASMFPRYIYCQINTNLLLDTFYFNSVTYSALLSAVDIWEIKNYLEKYNLTIEEFEKQYKVYGKGFIVPVISTNDSLKVIQNAFKNNN